jgi:parallel beta-helix repeat protein
VVSLLGDKRATIILMLALCLVVVSLPQIKVANAQSTIYIRADGSVEGTDKIQQDGNVYTFLGNISIDGSGIDGIIVEKDNIVIDGADYTLQITGTMESSRGLRLTDRTNVTIKNLQILGFNFGIQLQRSSGNTVFRNYIYPIGIKVNGSHNNTIIENHLVGSGDGIGIVMDIP